VSVADSRSLQIIEVARGLAHVVIPARAAAKVNLRLKVTGRRPDGYHLLSMLNTTVDLADELGVRFVEQGVEIVTEPDGVPVGPMDENLITKAFRAFWRQVGFTNPPIGLRCNVTKKIPIGAGLGGGSSDAGAVLRILVATFGQVLSDQLGLSMRELSARAVQAGLECGADVPYGFSGGLAWVSGIGEEVIPLKPIGSWSGRLLLMSPREAVNTTAFYKAFRELHPSITSRVDSQMEQVGRSGEVPFSSLLDLVDNDFERCVVSLAPSVGWGLEVVRRYFPAGSGVTGSGSAFFSVVSDADEGKIRDIEQELSARGVSVRRCSFNL
jgi:4-diphosphocytidyl-2-C-methyl-D-erythritol kinase